MTDFLLELRSEEIPARMQAGARADLEKLFRKEMDAAGVALGAITVWSTPRRLALIAHDLPDATSAVSEELKGPKVGAPPQALEGFLRKTGLTQDELTERDGVFFAISEKPGRATAAVLAEAIPAIIRAFPWPKSQRWGSESITTESLRWVRPLSGIVALFGQDLVECAVGDVQSGYATRGHRFHAPGEITIGSAADYQDKLRACHVIVDHTEREALIRERAKSAALAAGLTLVEDEGLVIENAGLTEWPVPLLGRFDETYLEVPPEVIQLTARTNQKYFVCEQGGKLANAFVCTANIEASDGGVEIVAGNRKVLAARLSDARFFWEQDRKKTLASHAEGLARITFHEKLGTVADKVERVAKLAEWLATEGIVPNCDPALARKAAELCKADLVTEMVGEFPELQGLMGGYYARAEGLPDAVADAIRDHYKPVGQGDDVPTAPVTVAVSLADKLDTLVSFFIAMELPTGSRDPFALRRAAISIIQTLSQDNIRLPLRRVIEMIYLMLFEQLWKRYSDSSFFYVIGNTNVVQSANEAYQIAVVEVTFPDPEFDQDLTRWLTLSDDVQAAFLTTLPSEYPSESIPGYDIPFRGIDKGKFQIVSGPAYAAPAPAINSLLDFFADRLKVQQREAGVRHDLIDAVFALGGEDDLVRLLARVHALQAFIATPDGVNLLAGYKRAANILKKEGYSAPTDRHPGLDPGSRFLDAAEGSGTPDQARGDENCSADLSPSYISEPDEAALIDALAVAAPKAAAAVGAEDFAGAMAALASLRAPIDAFFDNVTVNDADTQKRAARLSLLSRFRDAVHSVADFSKIEG